MWLWNSLKWYLEWVQKIKWKHISQKCTIVFVSFLDIQKDTQRATGELKWTAVVMETRCTVRLFSLSFPRKTASGSTFFTNRQTQPRLLCIQDIWMLLKKKKHLNLDLKAGLKHLWKKDRESDTGKQQQEKVRERSCRFDRWCFFRN